MATLSWKMPPDMQLDAAKEYSATLHTDKGDIAIKLLAAEAPKTVNNFVFLARQGFYDGVIFHRTINGFMIQTGDPEGTGRGGPGYRFDDEPVKRRYTAGTVAMANSGPNTNGSQFFIVHRDSGLPPNYTIFGQVEEGASCIDAIATAPTRLGSGGENSAPVEPVRISSIEIKEADPKPNLGAGYPGFRSPSDARGKSRTPIV
jgi:cyclophilin family peptidyl-prolyl cis-trans isomerase